MFSATLHSPEVRKLGEKICRFPTWVDLKGKDSTPDVTYVVGIDSCCQTVDFAFVWANPKENQEWINPSRRIQTDGIHQYGTESVLY